MKNKKPEKVYYFSVEGQTERLYLKWLEEMVNENEDSKYLVNFDIVVSKNPYKRVHSLPRKEVNRVYHLCDYESNDPMHVKQFYQMLDNIVKAKQSEWIEEYELGYCNHTFDLWIILHKTDSFGPIAHRHNYLHQINKISGQKFRGMQEYKRDVNFKRLLATFTFSDVLEAIKREKLIMKRNKDIGNSLLEYKGYTFYRENPSLTIGRIVESILIDTGVLGQPV